MKLTVLDLREARAALRPASAEASAGKPVAQAKAASPVLFVGQGHGVDAGFRRITQSGYGRDLTPPAFDRMQAVAYYLWATNSYAARIVELPKDYIVGEGFRLVAEDPAVQQVLDDFWSDPVNLMDQTVECFVRELSIFGEQCFYAASNPISGQVRLGYIDPSLISDVEYGTLDGLPGVAIAWPRTVILRRRWNEATERRLEIVHRDENPMSPTFGMLTGECFYFAVNRARSAARGISDLFKLADLVDGYDKMLFAMMAQVDSLSRFIWDVTLNGMTAPEVTDWLKQNGTPPRPNSIRAHNEKVTWQAVSPSLNAGDKAEGARLLRQMMAGGAGIPPHWLGDPGDANRAVAGAMGDPAVKTLTARQKLVRFYVEQIAQFVVHRAKSSGVLPQQANERFRVETPDLSTKDIAAASTAMGAAIAGLTTAKSVAAVDRETIARFIRMIGSQMGVDVDVERVLAAAQQEADAEDLRDYDLNPAAPKVDPA